MGVLKYSMLFQGNRYTALETLRTAIKDGTITTTAAERWRLNLISCEPWDADGEQACDLEVRSLDEALILSRLFIRENPRLEVHIQQDGVSVWTYLDNRDVGPVELRYHSADVSKKLVATLKEIREKAAAEIDKFTSH